ncbi:hypothetical protein D3C78_1617240 [compost metagenome]
MGGECLDGAGLGEARQAFQKDVAVGQQSQEHMANGVGLAEHHFRDVRFQPFYLLACSH